MSFYPTAARRDGRPGGGGRPTARPGRSSTRPGGGSCGTAARSVHHRLLGAGAGERPDLHLGVLRLVVVLAVTVPSQPRKNASGIETMPGLSSGNQWKSIDGVRDHRQALPVAGSTGLPDTTGEKMISVTQLISPPYMLHSAPRVLNRFQYSE